MNICMGTFVMGKERHYTVYVGLYQLGVIITISVSGNAHSCNCGNINILSIYIWVVSCTTYYEVVIVGEIVLEC